MKSLKAICPAVVLSLVLSVSALAGDVETPGAPIPPPRRPAQISETRDTAGVATAECSIQDEMYASGYADILWALTSIF